MVLQAAIEGLNATIGKAIGRIENAIAMSDQAQKASLALGMSLEGANRTLDGSIKGLRGSFGTRLQAGLAALNAGFQGNIESVGKLINQQQLTGGSFRKTAASLAKLETTMGLTRAQTSDLAEAMLETSQTFGVSTDKLVASLDALSESMPILTEAGLAGVPGAVAAMAGRVGPQMEQELKRVMGFLFDPSMETQGKLAALGLGNLRERMAAGQNPLDAFLDAIPQASNVIGQLGGDLSQFYAGFSVPLKMFGPVAKDFIALQKAMSARDMVEVRNQGEFFEQISVLKSEILAPLDMVFSEKLFPATLKFVRILSESFAPLVEKIKKKIESIFSDPEAAFDAFVDYADLIQDQLVKVFNKLITGVNFFTEAAIRFVEFIDGIPFVDAAPRQMRDDAARIKELESSVIGSMIEPTPYGVRRIPKKGVLPEDQKEYNALKKAIAEGYDRFVEASRIPQIKRDEERFRKIKAGLDEERNRLARETADNTAATADHTDPNKLKDQIPFMLDASITSLSDALLSISRRAVEEPDPIQEGLLSVNASQLDALENLSRGGIGRKL
jgi:hypothetical protein